MPSLFILPWVLREYKYRPKRITLLVADIVTSCIACPIIEEFTKLRLLQWTIPLSKNFNWVQKLSPHHKKQKRLIAEPIVNGDAIVYATSTSTITPDVISGTSSNSNKKQNRLGRRQRRQRQQPKQWDGEVTNI